MELKVFVYGTLKPGHARYQYYSDKVIGARAGIARGQLFALPAGYPAMTSGEGWVHGFVLSFQDSAILDQLDDYEDYQVRRAPQQNLYERQLIEVFDLTERFSYGDAPRLLGSAWAYVMILERIYQMGGTLLPSGWWG